MTTPTTPPLAALYAERAKLAYVMEHDHTPSRLPTLEAVYAELGREIATQAAQWPARWVRTPEATP